MNHEDRIAFLITKYIQNDLTEAERKELDGWRATNEKLFQRITDRQYLSDKLESYACIDEEAARKKIIKENFPAIELHKSNQWSWPIFRCIPWAALLLLFPAAGFVWWYCFHIPSERVVASRQQVDSYLDEINPGNNKATLTLNNDSVINIDEKPTGLVTTQENYIVQKEKIDMISFIPGLSDNIDPNYSNTITTPAGGTIQVKLADGSSVWLNANSSVTFNPCFTGNTRRVQITGQVYFEVTHDETPFVVSIVSSRGESIGEVQVLGTHFAINAYDDEPVVKTTLLQGSVKIKPLKAQSKWALLKPGQQAQMSPNRLSVIDNVNTEGAIAWKNGLFFFDSLSVKQVMQQVARWYDAQVIYEATASKPIVGYIPKNVPVSQVLKIIELTGGVHFKVEGKRITVTN